MKASMIKEVPFNGLFVGKSGKGKSAAIASFVEAGPIEWWSIDGRWAGIFGALSFLPKDTLDKINLIQFDTVKGEDVFAKMEKQLDIYYVKRHNLPFKTIVIEEACTLAEILLINSMRLRGVLSSSSEAQKKDAKGKMRGRVAFAHPDDYNYVMSAMRLLYYEDLKPLKCNIIFAAWIVDEWGKDPDNEYGPQIKIGTALNTTRKLAEKIPGLFDETYFFNNEPTGMKKDPVKYTVQFEPTTSEASLAKTCIPALKGRGKVDVTNKSFYKVLKDFGAFGKEKETK